MKLTFKAHDHSFDNKELVIAGVFSKSSESKRGDKSGKTHTFPDFSHWPKDVVAALQKVQGHKHFKGNPGETFSFTLASGGQVVALGMGNKQKATPETLRKEIASAHKQLKKSHDEISVAFDTFTLKNHEDSLEALAQGILLANYSFEKHLSKKSESPLKAVTFFSGEKSPKSKKYSDLLNKAEILVESINLARDFVNEPPNLLHSEEYAKRLAADARKITGVKVKILGKQEMKKEKMGMFLSVNAGSGYEPQLVHLTYTPKAATKNTKHVVFVGKGLTFDTGGYSLKPSASMVNMKFDMAGSATVYGAFRALAKLGAKVKVSCILGLTDNAINSLATMPDSIVVARNGKTVEILNTDAEGRLVLGDCLDYACDLKPDYLIDAATLTGAVLVALGSEVCGLMGNNQKMNDKLLSSAKAVDEYMWQLPIIPEWHKDIKSLNADLKNIGSPGTAGTAKAAAFLENFVKPDVHWAHLDIAGIGDSQAHLPYCPSKGASGLIVRTLVHFAQSV